MEGKEIRRVCARAYQILTKLVEALNGTKPQELDQSAEIIFGPEKIGSKKQKEQPFGVVHPTWLAGWYTFCTGEWLETVEFSENLINTGQKLLATV